jgi:hypothetical protein
MAGIDWNRAWQTGSRWLKQGTGLLFARPLLWLGLALLESLATAWLGSGDVLSLLLSLVVLSLFLCTILLLAWRVALRPGVPFTELALGWAASAGRIFMVSLPLAAAGLVLVAGSQLVGPLSFLLWPVAWVPCLWVFLPALLVDGLSAKSSLGLVMQTSPQRWASIAVAVFSLLALAAAALLAAFLLMSLLKLLGGQLAAAAGMLLLLLPAALLLGVLPVLCAFAASRDTGVS